MRLIAAVLRLGVMIAFAAVRSEAQPRQAAGKLEGVVLNEVTARPIAGVVVMLRPAIGRQEEAKAIVTGNDGKFTFEAVLAGKYTVAPEKVGFIAAADNPASIDIANRSEQERLTLRLTPPAVITGRISSVENESVAGASVQLVQIRLTNSLLERQVVEHATTNDLGEYRFHGVRPGSYLVRAHFRDLRGVFSLRKKPSSDGQLRSEDYLVTYYPASTDIEHALALRVSAGSTVENINVALQMGPSAEISGAVRRNLFDGAVQVFLQPADHRALGINHVFEVDSGKTDFRFESVPPGDYVLRAVVPVEPSLHGYLPLAITGSPLRNLALDVHRAPSIRGRCVGSVDRDEWNKVRVVLHGVTDPVRAAGPVQEDGSFFFPMLPPGLYRVSAESLGQPTRLALAKLDGVAQPGLLVSLTRSTERLELHVETNLVRLEGQVADSNGDKLSSPALVLLLGENEIDGPVEAVRSDDTGFFRLTNLLPGGYRIIALRQRSSLSDLSEANIRQLRSKGRRVELTNGLTTQQIRAEDPIE